MPAGAVLFPPRLARPRGPHDGGDWRARRAKKPPRLRALRQGPGFSPGLGRSGRAGCLAGIDQVAQLLGGLEVRNLLGRDLHALASFGIAPDAWIALANAERAESANLDLVSALQCANDGAKDGFNDHFAVAA